MNYKPFAIATAIVMALAGCGGGTKRVTVTKTVAVTKTVTAAPGSAAATSTNDPSALGGDSSAATTTDRTAADANLDPCTLLTKAEAQKLSGVPMLAGASAKGVSCTYDTDPNATTSQVNVYIDAGAKQTYDLDTSLGHTFTPIAGIGDAAYIETGAAFVRKGARWAQVSDPFLEDSPQATALLKAALTTIAGRF